MKLVLVRWICFTSMNVCHVCVSTSSKNKWVELICVAENVDFCDPSDLPVCNLIHALPSPPFYRHASPYMSTDLLRTAPRRLRRRGVRIHGLCARWWGSHTMDVCVRMYATVTKSVLSHTYSCVLMFTLHKKLRYQCFLAEQQVGYNCSEVQFFFSIMHIYLWENAVYTI